MLHLLGADLVIMNGKIVTVDGDFSIAEAVAVKNGVIMAVGDQKEISALIGKDSEVLDLGGGTMLPGIIDSHLHLAAWSTTRPPLSLDISYPNVKSIQDVTDLVKKKASELPPGEWIRGYGWDESYFSECQDDKNRRPTRWDLDPVSPDHPVCLSDFTGGHILWVNGKALEMASIDRNTPEPEGGDIIRDSGGEPTGILNEFGAAGLVQEIVPPWTPAEKRKGILAAMQELNRIGITSVTDPGLGPNTSGLFSGAVENEAISIYNALCREKRLTVRIGILLLFGEFLTQDALSLDGMKTYLDYVATNTGFGNDMLKIAGIKLGSDSMPLNKTSWMHEEYVGGGNGHLLVKGKTDEERYRELVDMIVYASKRRFQLGVHSTGDRAIDAVVDGFVKALEEDPWDARHYVIHGDFATPLCAGRIAKHRIGVSANSAIKRQICEVSETVVGADRAAYQWPLKTLINAGVHVGNASDAPVIYPDWLMGIEAAVTRESKASGRVSGPGECLTREEALRTYTIEGAWLDHSENIKGSIEPGKVADFCILDQDILAVDVHEIHNIRNLMTIVDGRVVYNADSERLCLTKAHAEKGE